MWDAIKSFWNNFETKGGDLLGVGDSSARVQNQLNRDFQERMSNTAIQRRMEDMKKAGINPILAHEQGGASTPSGNTGAGGQGGNTLAQIGIASARAMAKGTKLDNLQKLQNIKSTQLANTGQKIALREQILRHSNNLKSG